MKPMRAAIGAMLLAMTSMTLGAACSSSTTYSGLPYRPEVAVTGATISAAYTIVSDRLRVEIDTGGHRLERAQIVKPDASVLEAQTIEYSAPSGAVGNPVSIGIGIGRIGGMGGVSTGVGVSTGGVVGGSGSSADANTIASFPLDQAGPRPWRVRVKLVGMEPADIVVGTP